MENSSAWLIVAKTNLHVGDENASSYGIIDKSIQRDALTDLPCVNSSSLKGALNEYATQVAELSDDERIRIFGVDKQNSNSVTKKGGSIFFDANILFLPVQDDNTLYKLVTCEKVLQQFVDKMELFGMVNPRKKLDAKLVDLGLSYSFKSQEKFKELCSDENLPIVARNRLIKGSENLWYEQFLPQETILGTLILSDCRTFEEKIEQGIIQIGANATIGYGYCKFVKL